VAASIDSSSRSSSMSRKYSPAATHRASSHARRVTSGVTCGLPSRSPPIHDPNRTGAASIGSGRPVLARSARSRLRTYDGSASQRLCSNTIRPLRTSSIGVGRCDRTSPVPHAASISRRMSATRSCCSGR
jgi:hypothetical protein